MARYKYIDTDPRFLPVDLARQLLPGTVEHAVSHLLDHEIDLSPFDARYRNDDTGAPAYPPAMLLTVVLCASAHGIVSRRGIERVCQEHVTFIIDGVKLPRNASKQRSGTWADVERQAARMEAAAKAMLERHRAEDVRPTEPDLPTKEAKRVERLERDARALREWLATHPEDRRGPTGGVRKSNRTDDESATMATGKGVIQGYTGVAAVDSANQVIDEGARGPKHGADLDSPGAQLIDDPIRPVNHFPDGWVPHFRHDPPGLGEVFEMPDCLDKSPHHDSRVAGRVARDEVMNGLEIRDRLRRPDDGRARRH